MVADQIGNEIISDPSLPHQREIVALVRLAVEAYEKNAVILVITDTHDHGRWLLNQLHRAVQWDNDSLRAISSKITIHRDGIEADGGGRIVVIGAYNISTMFGMRPTKVVLFGRTGEMYYHLMSYGCLIEAVA